MDQFNLTLLRPRITISLTTIGIITGIVLCILKACNILMISWFWATFAFWIVPACILALFIILLITSFLYVLFTHDEY